MPDNPISKLLDYPAINWKAVPRILKGIFQTGPDSTKTWYDQQGNEVPYGTPEAYDAFGMRNEFGYNVNTGEPLGYSSNDPTAGRSIRHPLFTAFMSMGVPFIGGAVNSTGVKAGLGSAIVGKLAGGAMNVIDVNATPAGILGALPWLGTPIEVLFGGKSDEEVAKYQFTQDKEGDWQLSHVNPKELTERQKSAIDKINQELADYNYQNQKGMSDLAHFEANGTFPTHQYTDVSQFHPNLDTAHPVIEIYRNARKGKHTARKQPKGLVNLH